jgi:hypothetical protein
MCRQRQLSTGSPWRIPTPLATGVTVMTSSVPRPAEASALGTLHAPRIQ